MELCYWRLLDTFQYTDCSHLLCLQFQATVEEGAVGVIVNLTVEDRDDPTTGAWRAAYTIINGNPGQSFEIHTNPQTNEGMLSVVKVRVPSGVSLSSREHRGPCEKVQNVMDRFCHFSWKPRGNLRGLRTSLTQMFLAGRWPHLFLRQRRTIREDRAGTLISSALTEHLPTFSAPLFTYV